MLHFALVVMMKILQHICSQT